MTELNKQALREAAIHAQSSDDWGYDDDNFHDKATPDAVLMLLDELEAAEERIAELEARTVVLPVTGDVHPLAPYEAKIFCEFKKNIVQECADAIRAAGIGVKGE